jgi:Protein phosphatase 2C
MSLMSSSSDPRAVSSPFAIGDAGRAARELPAGPPGRPIGQADAELSAAALPGMFIRAASVRGLLHRSNGTCGQDAFAIAQHHAGEDHPPRAITVVCDGVGALGRSHEAARLVSRLLAESGLNGEPWHDAFALANAEVQALAKQASGGGPDYTDLNGMATTAVAAAIQRAGDTWMLTSAWVGDSSLWHLTSKGTWSLLAGGAPEDGEESFHASDVQPLPSADGSCTAGEFSVSGGAIFLMSDGVANPLQWSREVRETLASWWARPPDPFTFAAQVGFARRSHIDDRTVVGIWADPGGNISARHEEPGDASSVAG